MLPSMMKQHDWMPPTIIYNEACADGKTFPATDDEMSEKQMGQKI
jgi:hypothetical protein